jgi:hypothetical protein
MVAGTGTYTWYSTQQLADDVRDWRASPSTNFGWILRGDEGSQQTAKRFVSRNSATNGPRLQIFYSIPTGTEAETPRAAIALSGNYPNPFRERTTIRFELDSTEEVTLEVFDVLGRRVETIAPGVLAPGLQEVTFYAGRLPAGVYFYRIEAAGRTATGSMLALE